MSTFEEDLEPAGLEGREQGGAPGGDAPVPIQAGKKLDLNDMRHGLALKLLYGLLALAGGVLIAATLVPVERLDSLREIATLIFTPLITLAGTSFAWFYATRKNDRS